MEVINLEQAEKLVNNVNFAAWSGWDLVIYDDRYDGFYKTNGIFKDGRWVTRSIFTLNKEGNYVVPSRLTKFIKIAGS